MRNVLAFSAALLAILSTVPYFIDIVRRRTKPNIVSWFTWTLLSGVGTAAALAAHQPRTALLTGATTLCTLTIVLLGFKYGMAKYSKFDAICQAGALVGLVLWLFFNSPTIAIIAVVSIDCIGTLPTVRHSWLNPEEETWEAFAIASTAAIFTIVSLQMFNTASLLYPVYLVVADGSVAVIVVYRRLRLGINLGKSGTNETLHG